MDPDIYSISLTFITICVLIELTPGPNMTYLAIVSLSQGRRAGFATVAGIALGLLLVGLATVMGFGVLLDNHPLLYETLRWFGVAYLLWLAWQGWRQDPEASLAVTMHSDGTYFRRGLITNLFNPKAAMFYVAMLPNFAGEGEGASMRGLALTIAYTMIATIVHVLVMLFSVRARNFLRNEASKRHLRRALSLALAGVAIWFAFNTAQA